MKTPITLLVFSVSSLLALGLVMLYSSGNIFKSGSSQIFETQLIACCIGLVVCVAVGSVDYRIFRKLAWPLFLLSVVLLAVVLTTPKINGAHRWFRYHGFSFQPSELGKIALIAVLAWYGERYQILMPTFKRGLVLPGILIGMILGLIVVEPDVGTTILLGVVSLALLLLAGARLRYCLLPILIISAALTAFILTNPVRSKRIHSWLNVEETKGGVGLQAWESRISFGAGGPTGRGLGSSRQKLLSAVPEQRTDFIFTIVGEELGLPATLGVLLGYVLLLWAGFRIAWRAPDTFGLLLGAGLTLLITLQAFVNIAVVTGVFPNKGLPLPFISYGGSNLILMLGCVGTLISIARHGAALDEMTEELPPAPEVAAQWS